MAGTLVDESVTYMTVPLTDEVLREVSEVAATEKRSTGEVILYLLKDALAARHNMNGTKS